MTKPHIEHVIGKMRLRPLTETDLSMTLAWRNEPRVRSKLLTTDPVSEDTHRAWFHEKYLPADDELVFIAEVDGKPVGQVGLSQISLIHGTAEFGRLVIGKPGTGFGTLATWGAIQIAFNLLGLAELTLCVRPNNHNAVRLYLHSGFEVVTPLDHPDVLWMRLSRTPRIWQNWDQAVAVAAIEHAWLADNEIAWRDTLAREVIALEPQHVCEIGCGSGLVAAALHRTVDRRAAYLKDQSGKPWYTGCDTSYIMLAKAREGLGVFRYGDAFHLPFPAASFDVVVSFEMLCHLPHIDVPIFEMIRVAQRHVLFTAPVSDNHAIYGEECGGVPFLRQVWTAQQVLDTIAEVWKGPLSVRHFRIGDSPNMFFLLTKPA